MNSGDLLYSIAKALLDFGNKFTETMQATIDTSKIKTFLSALNIPVNTIPDNLNLIALIGLFSGVFVIAIIIYKIFK